MAQNDTWVAPTAAVVGNVRLGDATSVWYGAVVRGDLNFVRLGLNTNVQEKAVIHTVETLESGFPAVVDIGEHVSVGPGCVLTSCTVENNVELGAGTVIAEGALVEKNSKLAPGTYVAAGMRIPAGEHWAGNPARFVSKLSAEEVRSEERRRGRPRRSRPSRKPHSMSPPWPRSSNTSEYRVQQRARLDRGRPRYIPLPDAP